ncbi:hypothetical protein [Halomicrococcus sp. NG-SE-24]|uniref:hypothetical protein n=1 Tax=Halomicrococcus sp. NG-SE-24 TaxID=3436928 RepID=UPI003D98473E
MASEQRSPLDGFAGVVVTSLGLFCTAIGVLLLPQSSLTGLWIAAIGANFLASVLVGTTWGRRRLGLDPGGTSAALVFVAIAVVLIVTFIVVNVASASMVSG